MNNTVSFKPLHFDIRRLLLIDKWEPAVKCSLSIKVRWNLLFDGAVIGKSQEEASLSTKMRSDKGRSGCHCPVGMLNLRQYQYADKMSVKRVWGGETVGMRSSNHLAEKGSGNWCLSRNENFPYLIYQAYLALIFGSSLEYLACIRKYAMFFKLNWLIRQHLLFWM